MALTYRNDIRDSILDSVFARGDLQKPMPKYKFPKTESLAARVPGRAGRAHARRQLAAEPRDVLSDVGRAGGPQAHGPRLDKNMIDKDEYPQTAELEARCVHMLADLWNSPDAANTLGTSTTGSSEAAMLGGMALMWRWRERREGRGQADRQAEPRHRSGADLLAQVRALLGRRACARSRWRATGCS